jgi:membrane protein required for colicin V production
VLGFALVRGAFRGLIREVLGICAVAGAYFLSNLTYLHVEPGLHDVFSTPGMSAGVAYALVFVGWVLLLMLAFRMGEHGLLRAFPVGAVNHAGGLVIGALKGTLVVAIALFLLRALPDGRVLVERSALAPLFVPVADALGNRFVHALPETARRPPGPPGRSGTA